MLYDFTCTCSLLVAGLPAQHHDAAIVFYLSIPHHLFLQHSLVSSNAQGVKIVPALQAIAVGLAIRFLAPIPEGITPQVTRNEQSCCGCSVAQSTQPGQG
eukprot:1150113-Pelagomonas_calceolata.AAC.4